jgi:cytochrome c peroxidase
LVFANAPIDQFARGDHNAMTGQQKRGALLFFGKAGCVQCHAVSGKSSVGFANEMFSDFLERDIAVPQLTPGFGVGKGNVIFDGPGANEDFGREELSGDQADRYLFRTSPLRNLAVSPGFFHNGAFIRLEDAIRHHLDVVASNQNYDPAKAGVPGDLRVVGPSGPALAKLDPILQTPLNLTQGEFNALVAFVRDGLLDPRAKAENLCKLVPAHVPSGLEVLQFEACQDLKK